MIGLAIAFFITALLYATAGFGGGSTYTALLVLGHADYRIVPLISLLCNILVTVIGSWRFAGAGHVDWHRTWPLFAMSVPMAWIGGQLAVGETLFVGLLALSLLVAGLLMLWQPYWDQEKPPARLFPLFGPIAGGALGFLAGVVGIGGGIFLAPLLYLVRWGSPRAIAGTSAVFILVNSVAGLGGQIVKSGAVAGGVLGAHWPLFLAVVLGGALGSTIGRDRIDPKYLRMLTALLVLYVAVRLSLRFGGLMGSG
ncbi:MAG: sulfite exporter TauE/SafE family protein [Sphingomicrobium sp.]